MATIGAAVKATFENLYGTIVAIHETPGAPELAEFSIEWDTEDYPDQVWSSEDFVLV